MAKRSKQKGSEFERLIRNLVLQAAGEPFDHKDLARTPLSGGHESYSPGDLQVSDRLAERIFPFSSEMKHRKTIKIEHALTGNKEFEGFHDQLLEACRKDLADGKDRRPLLVFRGMRGAIYCSLPLDNYLSWSVSDVPVPCIKYEHADQVWVLFDFKHFLSIIRVLGFDYRQDHQDTLKAAQTA